MTIEEIKNFCESVGIPTGKKDTVETLKAKLSKFKKEISFENNGEIDSSKTSEAIDFCNKCILLGMNGDAKSYYDLVKGITDPNDEEAKNELDALTESMSEILATGGTVVPMVEEAKTTLHLQMESKKKREDNAKKMVADMIAGKGIDIEMIRHGLEVGAELLAEYQKQERKKNKPTGRFRLAERSIRQMIKKQLR